MLAAFSIDIQDVRHTGKIHSLMVRWFTSVKDLKDKLSGIAPPSKLHLYHESQPAELRNNSTLRDFGIEGNGGTLKLVVDVARSEKANFSLAVAPEIQADKRCQKLVEIVRKGLENNRIPTKTDELDSSSGVYFMKNKHGTKVAVFKPQDEEQGMPHNPKGYSGKGFEGLRAHFAPGQGYIRECIAYLMDVRNFCGVPETTLVHCEHPVYHYGSVATNTVTPAATAPAAVHSSSSSSSSGSSGSRHKPSNHVSTVRSYPKSGSLQRFIKAGESFEDLGYSMLSDFEVQKIALLDMRILNCDRNAANILVIMEQPPHPEEEEGQGQGQEGAEGGGGGFVGGRESSNNGRSAVDSRSNPTGRSFSPPPAPTSQAPATAAAVGTMPPPPALSRTNTGTSGSVRPMERDLEDEMLDSLFGRSEVHFGELMDLAAGTTGTITAAPTTTGGGDLSRSNTNNSSCGSTSGGAGGVTGLNSSFHGSPIKRSLSSSLWGAPPIMMRSPPPPSPPPNAASVPLPLSLSMGESCPGQGGGNGGGTTPRQQQQHALAQIQAPNDRNLNVSTHSLHSLSSFGTDDDSGSNFGGDDWDASSYPRLNQHQQLHRNQADQAQQQQQHYDSLQQQELHSHRHAQATGAGSFDRFSTSRQVYYRLVPIDHGYCFPNKLEVSDIDWAWIDYPHVSRPVHPKIVEYMASLDTDKIIDSIVTRSRNSSKSSSSAAAAEDGGDNNENSSHNKLLSDDCIFTIKIVNKFIQQGIAAGLTLRQIAVHIARLDFDEPSKIEQLMSNVEDNAYRTMEAHGNANSRLHTAGAGMTSASMHRPPPLAPPRNSSDPASASTVGAAGNGSESGRSKSTGANTSTTAGVYSTDLASGLSALSISSSGNGKRPLDQSAPLRQSTSSPSTSTVPSTSAADGTETVEQNPKRHQQMTSADLTRLQQQSGHNNSDPHAETSAKSSKSTLPSRETSDATTASSITYHSAVTELQCPIPSQPPAARQQLAFAATGYDAAEEEITPNSTFYCPNDRCESNSADPTSTSTSSANISAIIGRSASGRISCADGDLSSLGVLREEDYVNIEEGDEDERRGEQHVGEEGQGRDQSAVEEVTSTGGHSDILVRAGCAGENEHGKNSSTGSNSVVVSPLSPESVVATGAMSSDVGSSLQQHHSDGSINGDNRPAAASGPATQSSPPRVVATSGGGSLTRSHAVDRSPQAPVTSERPIGSITQSLKINIDAANAVPTTMCSVTADAVVSAPVSGGVTRKFSTGGGRASPAAGSATAATVLNAHLLRKYSNSSALGAGGMGMGMGGGSGASSTLSTPTAGAAATASAMMASGAAMYGSSNVGGGGNAAGNYTGGGSLHHLYGGTGSGTTIKKLTTSFDAALGSSVNGSRSGMSSSSSSRSSSGKGSRASSTSPVPAASEQGVVSGSDARTHQRSTSSTGSNTPQMSTYSTAADLYAAPIPLQRVVSFAGFGSVPIYDTDKVYNIEPPVDVAIAVGAAADYSPSSMLRGASDSTASVMGTSSRIHSGNISSTAVGSPYGSPARGSDAKNPNSISINNNNNSNNSSKNSSPTKGSPSMKASSSSSLSSMSSNAMIHSSSHSNTSPNEKANGNRSLSSGASTVINHVVPATMKLSDFKKLTDSSSSSSNGGGGAADSHHSAYGNAFTGGGSNDSDMFYGMSSAANGTGTARVHNHERLFFKKLLRERRRQLAETPGFKRLRYSMAQSAITNLIARLAKANAAAADGTGTAQASGTAVGGGSHGGSWPLVMNSRLL